MIRIDILKKYFGVEDHRVNSSNQFICKCPVCGKEKHLYCSLITGKYLCFRCEFKGKVLTDESVTVSEQFDSEIKSVLESINLIDRFGEEKYWLGYTKKADEYFKSKDYLIKRGISVEEMKFYNLRYDFRREMAVFPNRWDSKEKTTEMYVARYLRPDGDKDPYRFPYQSNPKSYLFNLHNIKKDCKFVVITEGVINSIVSGRNSVALYSKFCSEDQLGLLLSINFVKGYYIALDHDAKEYAVRLAQKLREKTGRKIFLVNFRDNRDIADLGRKKFQELLINAIPFDNKLKVMVEFYE